VKRGKSGLSPSWLVLLHLKCERKVLRKELHAYPKIIISVHIIQLSNVAKAMDVTNDMLTSFPNIKVDFLLLTNPVPTDVHRQSKAKGKQDRSVVAFDAAERNQSRH
jgi:ABC-type sugar transport system substrate-binding protein